MKVLLVYIHLLIWTVTGQLQCYIPNPIATFFRMDSNGSMSQVTEFSTFTPTAGAFFVVHGWTETHLGDHYDLIGNDLARLHSGNVVLVDYGEFAREDYATCGTLIVRTVGDFVAQHIITAINANQTSVDKIHLIGHSLGSHVCGQIARVIAAITGNSIHRITALDGAGPFFAFPLLLEPNYVLSKRDARFVDSLHTTTVVSAIEPIGHVDFYALGVFILPVLQKACIVQQPSTGCSHGISKHIFRESIGSPNIIGKRFTGNGRKYGVYGYYTNESVSGVYFFQPSFLPPYGCGRAFCF